MSATAVTVRHGRSSGRLRGVRGHRGVGRAAATPSGAAGLDAPVAVVAPVAEREPAHPTADGRDRYIDSLRVLALGRVIAFHAIGWVWLPIAYPSMGVMFALAGSLMAASLDRSPRDAGRVIRKRMKRLLLPFWAFGACVVTAMLVLGWTPAEADATPLDPVTALAWVVPWTTPPASAQGNLWVLPMWYIATYVWLVVMSPALLWLFRRWHLRTFCTPLVLLVLFEGGVLQIGGGPVGDMILRLVTFTSCWMLGFAHHDGMLRRMSRRVVVPAALTCIGLGLAWAHVDPRVQPGAAISDIPVADAFYGLGFVLLLLRFYVDMSWMRSVRPLDRLVGAINRRALTIYLWGNVAIGSAAWVMTQEPLSRFTGDDALSITVTLLVVWLIIGVCVVAFGWIEDIAAGRHGRTSRHGDTLVR